MDEWLDASMDGLIDSWLLNELEKGGNGGWFCLNFMTSLQRYSVCGPCQKDIPSNCDRSIKGKACIIRLLPLRVRTTRHVPNPWKSDLWKHNQPITIPPPWSLFFFFRRKCGQCMYITVWICEIEKIKVSRNIRRVTQLMNQSVDLWKCCSILHRRKYLHYLVVLMDGWMVGLMDGWMEW